MTSSPGEKPVSGLDEFRAALLDYQSVSSWAVGGTVAVPLVDYVVRLGPPWPWAPGCRARKLPVNSYRARISSRERSPFPGMAHPGRPSRISFSKRAGSPAARVADRGIVVM